MSAAPESKVGAAWEPIWQGNGEAQAEIVALALRNAGIAARVQGARPTQGFPHAFLQDTWAVFVPVGSSGAARRLLVEQHEGANIVGSDDDVSALQRSTIKFALAGLFVIGAYVAYRALTGGL